MERLSILVDGDMVMPSDLPAKILDEVGDLAALPEPEPPLEVPLISSAPAEAAAPAGGPAPAAAAPGEFVWPTLSVLEARGMNLKDFLDTVEGRLIDEALARAEGVKNQAAEYLGIKRTTLIAKLKKRGA